VTLNIFLWFHFETIFIFQIVIVSLAEEVLSQGNHFSVQVYIVLRKSVAYNVKDYAGLTFLTVPAKHKTENV